MDFVETLQSINVVDILVILFLFGMFVLGYIQGTIRRLVGLLSVTFSFFLAALLSVPVGEFLAANWTQYPTEYSVMIGFGVVFVAAVVAFAIVVQGTYQRQELFAKYPVIDEVLGGILGVVQGAFLVGCLIVILDSYFLIPGAPTSGGELPFLRGFFDFYTDSGTAELFRTQLIPGFFNIFGILIPDNVQTFYTNPPTINS